MKTTKNETTTISVTANEASVLHGINKSEYADENGRGTWVFSIEASTKGKALGGVLASLATKGLIELGGDVRPNGASGEDAYANLTELGLAFVAGEPGFTTVAKRASKSAPKTEPTTAAAPTPAPKETIEPAAAPSVRPQTEKLLALNLAMCAKGRLFSAKAACKCCGASLLPAEVTPPIKKSRSRTAKWDTAASPVTSEATRAKNADAKAARAAKRQGTALASVGSGS